MTTSPRRLHGPVRILLALSVPIAALAMAASLAGVLVDATYAAEAPNWAAQAVGQDVVNVVVAYPLLLVLAWLASRGSLRAYLAWLGVLAYSAYSYLLYAGFLHFGGWFLVHVAVLGLSVFALAGGVSVLAAERVRAAFGARAPTRSAGGLLIAFGLLFGALWLSDVVPAAVAGQPLEAAVEAGLVTNPVYVLDLALFLPAMVLTGVLLVRRRAVGYLLALPLYVWGVVMGVAVVAMLVSTAVADEVLAVPPVVMMAVTAAVKLVVAVRLLAVVRPDAGLDDALGPRSAVAAAGPVLEEVAVAPASSARLSDPTSRRH